MNTRITRLVNDLRTTLKGPIVPSLLVSIGIVGAGIYINSDGAQRNSSNSGVVATSTLPFGADPALAELARRIPQLLATSSTSTLTEDQKKYFDDYLKSEGDRIGGAMLRAMITKVDKTKFQTRYNLSDLKIVSDDSEGALRAYAHAMGVITNKYAALKVEKPDNILKRALEKKDRNAILSLSIPATDYRNFANELKALPVPQLMAEYHLMVVNGYDVMGSSLFQLTRLFDDPAAGNAAWQSYIYQSFYMTKGYAGLIAVFHEQGVNFTDKSDPSYNFRWRGDLALPPVNKTSN